MEDVGKKRFMCSHYPLDVRSWDEEGESGNRLGGFEDLQGSASLIGRQRFNFSPRENITGSSFVRHIKSVPPISTGMR